MPSWEVWGYWQIGGNALTRRVLKSCVLCRGHFGCPLQQKMVDLPPDCVKPDQPPFTSTGVDYFGPIVVKQGRSLVRRYGVLFTCLASRAFHLEMAASLDTDVFINALHWFVARHGQVKSHAILKWHEFGWWRTRTLRGYIGTLTEEYYLAF